MSCKRCAKPVRGLTGRAGYCDTCKPIMTRISQLIILADKGLLQKRERSNQGILKKCSHNCFNCELSDCIQ